MKLKHLVILVLIFLLLSQSFAQRGGGGRSRSRSSRSKGKSGKGGGGYQGLTLVAIIIYALYQFVMWIYNGCKNFYRWMRYGHNQFQRIGSSFINRYRHAVNKMNQKQLQERLNQFVKKTWKVSYKNSYSDRKYFDFKIDKFTKKSDYVYEFKGTGSNEKQLGNSKMNGIILFHNDEVNLCFQKIYDDKQKAGQKERWDMLIYEVWRSWTGNYDGKWFYENFEKDPSFSGLMEMREAPGK